MLHCCAFWCTLPSSVTCTPGLSSGWHCNPRLVCMRQLLTHHRTLIPSQQCGVGLHIAILLFLRPKHCGQRRTAMQLCMHQRVHVHLKYCLTSQSTCCSAGQPPPVLRQEWTAPEGSQTGEPQSWLGPRADSSVLAPKHTRGAHHLHGAEPRTHQAALRQGKTAGSWPLKMNAHPAAFPG